MKLCNFCKRPAEEWSSREVWFHTEQRYLTICTDCLRVAVQEVFGASSRELASTILNAVYDSFEGPPPDRMVKALRARL